MIPTCCPTGPKRKRRVPSQIALQSTLVTGYWFLLAAILPTGCGSQGASKTGPVEPIVVFAAASTADALEEILAKFSGARGVETRTNFAASSTLAQQIVNGAEADLFLSANESWAEEVAKAGLVAERSNLLSNSLVVVIPRESSLSISQLSDLENPQVKRIAMGDPQSVPAGVYAREALEMSKLWEAIRPKVVAAADVRQALVFVETGAADAGIVFATDAQASSTVKVALRIDPSLSSPIRYPLILVKRSPPRSEAKALYDFLRGPTAAGIFERHGFMSPTAEPSSQVP
jgi:molybdate transport system substrate-binding protein